ncbi:MAG: STAS domain-containing protein [Bacillota bacterium]
MKVEIKADFARIIFEEKLNIINMSECENEFKKLIEDGINDIILDFKNLKEVDSFGLGKILHFNKIVEDNGGNLKIENVNSEYIKRVFKVVKLSDIIEIY